MNRQDRFDDAATKQSYPAMNRTDMSEKNDVAMLSSVMNVPSALKRLGNDRELFDEIVEIYLEDAPELLQTAHRALAGDDAVGLRRAAHSLKGLTATLSADKAVSAALDLEQIAVAGNLSSASESLELLTCRLAELNESLQTYRGRPATSDQRIRE
jgi:HPt (histidine-containing phosphotransfer) domain-containing protein